MSESTQGGAVTCIAATSECDMDRESFLRFYDMRTALEASFRPVLASFQETI